MRTTALALSYSTAEYASAVWARSRHAKKVDPELNNACRIVTGQLRPTPLPILYRTAGIAPPHIRREINARTEKYKQETDVRHPMFDHTYPDSRLKSRKSIRTVERLEPDLAAAIRQLVRMGQHPERGHSTPYRTIANRNTSLKEGLGVA